MSAREIIFPVMIICGFATAAILVAMMTTGWLFRVTDGRLRQCPNCKRKGAGYIFKTDTVESQSHMDFSGRTPLRITNESFEDHYECEHCGHTWIIPFQRTSREKRKLQKR